MVFNPSAPMPGGWFAPTGTTSTDPRGILPGEGGVPGPSAAMAEVERWERYMAIIQQAMQESSGWERIKQQQAMEDAQKARDNAMAMARLQAETSRYGTDVSRETAMAQLRENQRQFDQSHALQMAEFGLDRERFGLDFAKTYATFASTPDMMFARNDFLSAVNSVRGGGGPQPLAAQGRPQPKNLGDFYALTGYGQGTPGAPAPAPTGGGGGPDPRVRAADAIMKAIPPSQTPGQDAQDWAALDAITSLYFAGKPWEVDRLGKERQKIAQAGLARAGYDPRLVDEERRRNLPGQRSPSLA